MNITTLFLGVLFIIFSSMVVFAEEIGTQTFPDLSMKIRMEDKRRLLFEIANTTNLEQQINSNIKGVFDFTFLEFPTKGELQYRSSSGEILSDQSTKNGWFVVCAYSSQADPPDKAAGLKRMSAITIPAHSFLAFPIEYDGAVKISTSEFERMNRIPSEFRVKLVIGVMESGKHVEKEIISDWFPCAAVPKE